MRVFAIADPHLSRATPKPMTIFGGNWDGHPDIFFTRWREHVRPDDLVLIPGDISWAMHLHDALPDLHDIAALPGCKVLLRGNHDYWWGSISKVRAALPSQMYALQNDALRFTPQTNPSAQLSESHIPAPQKAQAGVVIAGTRGWTCPGGHEDTEHDEKIYLREVERLKLSLARAQTLLKPKDKLVVMLHYPPTNTQLEPSKFTETLLQTQPQPDALVFGHLHGATQNNGRMIESLGDMAVNFVAADALAFTPKLLFELPSSS